MDEKETLESAVAQDSTSDSLPEKNGKLSRRKKLCVSAGVAAAVLVVAVAGGLAWHEQPSFCSAICHTPMTNSYLTTLESTPGEPSTDKWGNEVEDARGMMAATHAQEGEACLDCHVPTVGEQLTEGMHWLTGNYEVEQVAAGYVVSEVSLGDLVAARGASSAAEFCLNDGCHNISREELAQKTEGMSRNPHNSHLGDVDCGECHKAHRASVMYCSRCHSDADIPEGWISYQQSQQLENTALLP